MPEFTASDPGSSFPNQNILFNSASGITGQQIQQNQLGLQSQQMQLTAADHEQVGRLAAGLLAEPDLGKRADLYARGVGMLQAQNLAKYAPPTLPDESTLRSLVSQTIPAQTQAEWLQNLTANKAYTNAGNTASTAAPGATGDFGTRLAQSESGGKTSVINQQGYTGTYQFGKQRLADLGYYTPAPGEDMKNNTTWAGKVSVPGFNVTDQQSFAANPAAQQAVFNTHLGNIDQAIAATPGANRFDPNGLRAVAHLGGIEGMQKFVASGGAFSPSDANGTSLVAYYNKFSGGAPGGATTATAAPATAPPGQPVPTQVAGPPMVSTAPPGSTAAPAAPTLPLAQTDTTQPPAPAQPGQPQPQPAPVAQPGQPGVRQPPQPPQPPPAAPLPPPPQMPVLNANGLTDIQQRQVNALAANPQNKQPAVAAAQQAFVNQNIQLRQQAFSDYMQQQQLAVAQGTLSNAQYEARLKAWQAANPVPTTPRFGEGSAVWSADTKTWDPVTGDNMANAVQGHWAVNNTGQQQFFPISPAATQAQSEAKAAGTAAGTATGKLTSQLADQGRTSAQAIGNIDYGLSQLDKAKAGGINTGYFAPWLSTIGAVAKSLGIPTEAIGVDPAAVGNIQTAQKTLAVVSGAILQQVLGSDSQITDAKIQHFIHAQPGIETDPAAVSRVLNWARSQFVYEREQAAQGMKDASASGGVLPANWQASYYDKHGFAPIYNPGTGEMQQPDGQVPPRQAPASLTTAPINPAARTTGTVYSTPKGPMKWTGTGWLPVQ